MGCQISSNDYDRAFSETSAHLKQIVTEAKQLRHFCFDGHMEMSFFRDQGGPNLEKLELGHNSLKARDLISIAKAYRGTSRSLTLRNLRIKGPEVWIDVGTQISNHLRLLHYLRVENLTDDVSRNTISEDGERSCLSLERCLTLVPKIMQWVPHGMLEVESGPECAVATLKETQTDSCGSEDDDSEEETSSEQE